MAAGQAVCPHRVSPHHEQALNGAALDALHLTPSAGAQGQVGEPSSHGGSTDDLSAPRSARPVGSVVRGARTRGATTTSARVAVRFLPGSTRAATRNVLLIAIVIWAPVNLW